MLLDIWSNFYYRKGLLACTVAYYQVRMPIYDSNECLYAYTPVIWNMDGI